MRDRTSTGHAVFGPEPPFVGREEELRLAKERIDASGPRLINYYGPDGIGKTSLLREIMSRSREAGRRLVYVDLSKCATPVDIAEAFAVALAPTRRWWKLPESTFTHEKLAEIWPLVAEAMEPPLADGSRDEREPARVKRLVRLLVRHLKRLTRWLLAGWVRQQTKGLPPRGHEPGGQRAWADCLTRLLPQTFARDVHRMMRRRWLFRKPDFEQLVLLVDGHERCSASLAAASLDDFVVSFADKIYVMHTADDLDVDVTIVLARETPLPRQQGQLDGQTWIDPEEKGVVQSAFAFQRRIKPLDDDDAGALLTDSPGPLDPSLSPIVDFAAGNPRTLIDCARYGFVPPATGASKGSGDDPRFDSVAAKRLAELSWSDRRLLGFASLACEFDLALLGVLTNDEPEIGWIRDEVDRGMIEPVGDATAGNPTWRVEPAIRALLFSELANDRQRFKDAHRRAIDYLDRPRPDSPDERFIRKVRSLYHRVALDPASGLDRLVNLAEKAIGDNRLDHGQRILDSVDQLYVTDEVDQVKALLLKVKLYSDWHGYGKARALLSEAAADRVPLAQRFTAPTAAIELQIAKLDRLEGAYGAARERYLAIADAAKAAGEHTVVAHCDWQLSIVHARLQDLPAAQEAEADAQLGLSVLLAGGVHDAAVTARRFGIRKVHLKNAHLERHRAHLQYLSGNYASAHASLDAACAEYKRHGEKRAHQYADVTRSHILRLEGLYDDSAALARAVVAAVEGGPNPDERLRLRAAAATLYGRVAAGDAPVEDANALIRASFEGAPAARRAGYLALAEIFRRQEQWPAAIEAYRQAGRAALRSNGRIECCGALLGLLECYRAGEAPADAGLAPPERMLAELLDQSCVEQMPWLGLRTQLQRAYWRRAERDAAMGAAARIAASFERRVEDKRIDSRLLTRYQVSANHPDAIFPMRLEHL